MLEIETPPVMDSWTVLPSASRCLTEILIAENNLMQYTNYRLGWNVIIGPRNKSYEFNYTWIKIFHQYFLTFWKNENNRWLGE